VARPNEQIMPLLVVTVLAQLVFSGGMNPVTNRILLNPMSWATPSGRGFAASASTVDLTYLVPAQLAPRDSHWTHTTSAWVVDMAVLVALSIFFTVSVRWNIRLVHGVNGSQYRGRVRLPGLSPENKGPTHLRWPTTVPRLTSLPSVATRHTLRC
jgi:hypothetical protein